MYNIMDKRSKVNSQLSDKIYETTLDDIDPDDNEINSELYKIKIFGKQVIIAPGGTKEGKTGIKYFYVYVIKKEKVFAKLGVYEKKTDEEIPLYDLTTFEDGSLLLFDIFYNKPDLINLFENDEYDENMEEELEEPVEELEEKLPNKKNKNTSQLKEITALQRLNKPVVIEGYNDVDYIMKGIEIFDLNNVKAGDVKENKIEWIPKPKNNGSSPNYIPLTDIKLKTGIQNAFDYLNDTIQQNMITIVPNVKDTISIMKTIIQEKGQTVIIRRTLTNVLTDMFGTTLNKDITNKSFFEDLKKLQGLRNKNFTGLDQIQKSYYILFLLENFLDVKFYFKDENLNNISMNEINNIEFIVPSERNKKKSVLIIIKKNVPYIPIKSGTGLNYNPKPDVESISPISENENENEVSLQQNTALNEVEEEVEPVNLNQTPAINKNAINKNSGNEQNNNGNENNQLPESSNNEQNNNKQSETKLPLTKLNKGKTKEIKIKSI